MTTNPRGHADDKPVGVRHRTEARNPSGSIFTQHLSLPNGGDGAARQVQEPVFRTIVPRYLPSPCRFPASFDNYHVKAQPKPTPARCRPYGSYLMPEPPRYFVNITSHIQYYRSLGVDARAVLVIRDPFLHFKGVLKLHNKNETAALEQYAVGKRIMEEALVTVDPVVVSYETLMTLRGPYWKEIYRELDIDSSHMPKFVNGNLKYERNISLPLSIQRHLG
jgi:hypothetical protein